MPADNVERAGKFYRKVFRWEISSHEAGHSHITTVRVDKNWVPVEKGAVNGGLFKRVNKKETPMPVITVKSIDKSLSKVKAEKGRVITPKTAAGEWGFWAEIQDPDGNVLELWEDNN